MYTELKQHLWLHTPHGEARCIAVIDYGQEEDLLWVSIQQDEPHTGELWTWHNSEVRVLANRSFLRGKPTKIGDDDAQDSGTLEQFKRHISDS
jgi:hypothetical protein